MSTCTMTARLHVDTDVEGHLDFTEYAKMGKLRYRLVSRTNHRADYIVMAEAADEIEAIELLCRRDHGTAVGPGLWFGQPDEIVPAQFVLSFAGRVAILAHELTGCDLFAQHGPIDVDEAADLIEVNPGLVTASTTFRDGEQPR